MLKQAYRDDILNRLIASRYLTYLYLFIRVLAEINAFISHNNVTVAAAASDVSQRRFAPSSRR